MKGHWNFKATILVAGVAFAANAFATDWLQFGYDQAHSSNNPAESGYPVASATAAQWSVNVHAFGSATAITADSTPVYLSNVVTASGTKDLLFLVTQNGTLVAFAASDGSVVWSKRPTPFTGSNLTTGAAAVDPSLQYVYAYGLDGNVHKYQVGDGTEILTGGWPELSTSKPNVEKGASGLAIASPPGGIDYLYHATNGYVGDNGDYQGHVTTVNLSTGAQVVFNAMCSNLFMHFADNGSPRVNDCNFFSGNQTDGKMTGIWGRPGVIYDAQTNRIYFATGNGLYDANATSGDHFEWGDSVLSLNPDGTGLGLGMPVDAYTPSNFAGLYSGDTDLGSTAPAILPSTNASFPHLAVQSGKDSCMRLINLDNMSGAGGPGHAGGELNAGACSTDAVGGGVVFPQPAVWVNPADGATWFFIANGNGNAGNGHLAGYRLNVAGTPSIPKQWSTNNGGTSPLIANNILYYASNSIVRAVDPLTGSTLWSGTIGAIKWQSPIVVNSHLYITDNSSKLWSFTLDGIFKNGFQ
jgi:PQQ-like domain